ncbi:hypothetical protein Q5752_003078 [Cryptotrichosporon argae]
MVHQARGARAQRDSRSPVLGNSAFSAFDYFQNLPASANKPQPPLPQLSLKSPFVLNSPPLNAMGSPKVLGSPEPGAANAHRRSVQFPHVTAVNWARPLRQESRIFGASMQRSRRMRHSGSPSSSDSEPATPMPVTPDATTPEIEIPGRTWAVVSSCKGLGVSGIDAFDTSDLSELEPEPEPELSSGSSSDVSFDGLACTPPYVDLEAYSETFAALTSPNNLDELHCLRLAAIDLEAEARRVHRTVAKLERRIRRKAAPRLTEDELEATTQTPLACSSAHVLVPSAAASSRSSSASRPGPRRSLSRRAPASRLAAVAESSPAQAPAQRRVVDVDAPSPDATPRPAVESTVALRRSNFYASSRAAMSAIEFSPRTGASPASRFTLEVGAPSPRVARPPSGSDSDGYASTASTTPSSGPTTPRSDAASAAGSSPASVRGRFDFGLPVQPQPDAKQSRRLDGLDLCPSAPRAAKNRPGKLSRFFGRA